MSLRTEEDLALRMRYLQGGVALGPAFIMMTEVGADLPMPWWFMLAVLVGCFLSAREPLAALRGDGAGLGRAVAIGTLAWVCWYAGAWIGENGAEGLSRPFRWWLVAVMLNLWIEALIAMPRQIPGWLETLLYSRGGHA